MIQITDKSLESFKRNETIGLSLEVAKIVFRIMATILFGTDVDRMPHIEYTCPKSGEMTCIPLEEFFLRYGQDEFDAYMSVKGLFVLVLAKYNLIEPFKFNINNYKSMRSCISTFMQTTKDNDSVFKRFEALITILIV